MASAMYPNRHQYAFLRKLREHPDGLPTEHWPNEATWKRWMKRDRFRLTIKNLEASIRAQEDLFTAAAGARAGRMLHDLLTGGDIDAVEKHVKAINTLCRLVRIDHMRRKEALGGEAEKPEAIKPRPKVPQEPTLESAKEAVRVAKDRLEDAEIRVETLSLKNPFPDFRRGTNSYYNPVTNRRELPDGDVPAAEAGKGMDRVTRYFARHERKKVEEAAWRRDLDKRREQSMREINAERKGKTSPG